MSAPFFKLQVLTPDARVLEAEVESLVLPGIGGLFGVLARHAPMVAALRPGVMKTIRTGETGFCVVGDGAAEVSPDGVLVLAESFIRAADRDDAEDKLEEMLKAADAVKP